MIQTITLRNFKSFGEEQTIPLEPITVLVGPNNSGKSNFMSVGRFIANSVITNVKEAIRQEGGNRFLFYRPSSVRDGSCTIGWSTPDGRYAANLSPGGHIAWEDFRLVASRAGFERRGAKVTLSGEDDWQDQSARDTQVFVAPELVGPDEVVLPAWRVWNSLESAGNIKLSLSALRADSEVIPLPTLGPDGRGLAAVLGLWRGALPKNMEALERFVTRCLPEVEHIFVRPAPAPGHQRLWFQQKNGEQFDAEHISDGVLAFTALAMHAINAQEGQLFFIEEPEQSIHPKRLRELVDLLKDIVRERGCQFVIATHSTVLLNAFRDEPEAILLFRRSETGTRVKRLSDVPELLDMLQKTPPGDLLETGAFSTAF
ncbi:AAA family ATPase [Hyalangium rubrum]|uniref:AAA family ATPase n=1 Tax=Hyalangium rubrum TaxID=3103134 RepID=A0ABU5H0W7_9BACT|nr:AAA family ATPase [Hyalangium sp. s54d21]MDY7226747.1 AAA family ATPase [Hyalangium sp. s54d21]